MLDNFLRLSKGDFMENIAWSKTILSVYRYLKRMTYAFDRMVKSKAYNSFHTTSDNFAINNIFDLSESILDLTERKVTLINLKVLTDKALASMDKELAKILILKFFEGKKCDEIANLIHCSTRTYFRKLTVAYSAFYVALVNLGYDENRLEMMLKNENWIMLVYEDFSSYEKSFDIESEIFKQHIRRNLYFELKKVGALC